MADCTQGTDIDHPITLEGDSIIRGPRVINAREELLDHPFDVSSVNLDLVLRIRGIA